MMVEAARGSTYRARMMMQDETWVCAVVAVPKGKQPIVAVLKEGTEAECKEMARMFEENPDQVDVVGGDKKDTTITFVTCPKALLDGPAGTRPN